MSKYAINDTTLTAIADSIRAKGGTSDPIQVSNFASAIANLPSGGGLPPEALVITGDCSYRFAYNGWNWFIEEYGNQITTENISNANYMFNYVALIEVPFEINMSQNMAKFYYMFTGSQDLKTLPKINCNLVSPSYNNIDFANFSADCYKVRNLDNVFNEEDLKPLANIKITSQYSCPKYNSVIQNCSSLRTLPAWWYDLRFSEESTAYPSWSYGLYCNMFYGCVVLDEAVNIPVIRCNANQTSNMFYNSFYQSGRLKNITFETNDGTPYVVNWKGQTIDLSNYVGQMATTYQIITGNTGITVDKEIKDAATYESLKDDPDWFTTKVEYSRYNHDSAVATINSLPDTSAYLASAGGTNTIKFKGNSGSATDGGAINTLTEEEIAVAAAKGWTVSLV